MAILAAQQLTTAATLVEMAKLLHREGVAKACGGWVFNRAPLLRRRCWTPQDTPDFPFIFSIPLI